MLFLHFLRPKGFSVPHIMIQKLGKKYILAGKYTVCLKGQNQHFLKFLLCAGSLEGTWSEEKL